MHSASSNPNDLPLDVAIGIEESTDCTPQAPRGVEPVEVESLIARLTAIRERLFWLQAVWANSLSPDVALEADRYRQLFRDLADELRKQDSDAAERLIAGHEALLLAEPFPGKPKIPLAAQQWFEIVAELRAERPKPAAPKPPDYCADGLQSFLS